MKKLIVRTVAALMAITSLGISGLSADSNVASRVDAMMSTMTLEEKAGQMLQADTRSITPQQVKDNYIGSILSGGGASPENGNTAKDWADRLDSYQQAAIEGFGIPLIYGVDAVHGHNNVKGTTIFPHNIGLGQANDEGLMERIGAITAKEMRATGAHWTFTPTLGLPKNERWGRTYECFGEDAILSANLGSAYIKGSQGNLGSESAIATGKHFIGEGITTNGVNQGDVPWAYDSAEFQTVLENELLVPYRKAIAADVKSMMVSYNSINGVKCHGNQELITDLLKGELGFKGIVVSDYNGVDQIEGGLTYQQQVVKAVNAGMDMIMVDGFAGNTPKWQIVKSAIIDGHNNGAITMDRIDDAVRRILTVKVELGFMDNPSESFANRELLATVGNEEHREVAREAVRKSLTLLKNTATQDGDSTLMLDLKDMDKIVVAGSAADDIGMQCGGWTMSWQGATGNVTKGTTIFSGLREVAGGNTEINYNANGYFADTDYQAAIVVVGETPYAEYAGDRGANELRLSSQDIQTINRIKKDHPDLPIVAVLTTGRPITILEQEEYFDAIIMAGFPGSEGAGIADVLVGDYDFGGKLTMTWPWYAQDIESKFEDPSKVMFSNGRGLTKSEITPLETTQPQDPYIVDLGETNGVLEAENFVSKHPDIVLENNGTSIGYFWDGRDLVYRVKVPETGRYTLALVAATANASVDAAVDIYVDGKKFYNNSTPLLNTGGWGVFKNLEMTEKISLPEGIRELKIVSRSKDFNVDKFIFTPFDSNYQEPEDIDNENIGTGVLIQEGAVSVTESSSDNSQSMSWYAGDQEIKYKNTEQTALDIRNADTSDMTTIVVNDTKEYQSILGMGISIEESTVNNLMKMSDATRKEFITTLLDPKTGMGTTLIRVTIGTSDFTGQPFYTYYDGSGKELNGKPDWNNVTGNGFSIQKDRDIGIIQVIKEIQEVAEELGVGEELQFFASSWTPPGWMKTATSSSKSYANNTLLLKGGRLNDDYINDLAKYYVRFIEEYQKEGIPIYAMTLQNEPLLEINYPSCYITGSQEAKMAEAIKKELKASTVLNTEEKGVKVWAFDHNFDGAENYVRDLFDTVAGRDNVDGIAFHPYGGQASTMGSLYTQYQDQYTMHLTERSVWGASGANDIINWLRNGAESYNGWVTMLDSKIAPHQWVGTPDPTLFVQDANNREKYWATPEVYITGQFSKYIRSGYVRVDSSNGTSSSVTNVAFKDPDTGKIVLVVTNTSGADQNFKVVLDGTQFNATLKAGNIATYIWDPVDRTSFKNITDELTLSDANISGDGQIIDGDLGYITDTTTLDYFVNVKDAGTYKVEFDVAPGGEWDINFPIRVSQEGETLGEAHVMRYIWWGDDVAWSTYTKVQTYVTFDEPGLQSFRVSFPLQGMNFRGLKFTKEEAVQSLPGVLHTENYFDNYGLIKEGSSITNFGFIVAEDYVDYKVDIQKTAVYDMVFTVATSIDGSQAVVESVDEQGNVTVVDTVTFGNTGDLEKYKQYTTPVSLSAGTQILRIRFKNGDTNFRSVVIGQGIEITQDELIEGEMVDKTFSVKLLNGTFNPTLNKDNWHMKLPKGVTYKIERISGTEAKVTFLTEATIDFDTNQIVKLEIDSSEYNGVPNTSVVGYITIIAIDDDEELFVSGPVAFGQEKLEITIEGGTFREEIASYVTLGGQAAKYVTIDSVEYVSHKIIKLHLSWQAMYGDNEGIITIGVDGYDDGSIPISVATIFKATTEKPTAITVDDVAVMLGEESAYRNVGSLKTNPQKGNYIDFYLDVKEESEYVLKYKVKTNEAISNALKISGGAGLATDNLVSISFGKFWDNTVEYRNSLRLDEGQQTIRFEMNTAGFELQQISIEKAKKPVVVGEQATVTVDDLIGGSKTKGWGIENKQGILNIGNTESGSYQEYVVDVEKAGIYSFSINAGGNSGNTPQVVLQSTLENTIQELGRIDIPNTGGWDTFVDSETIEVGLTKGKQTLRIYNDIDGFNYRSFTLSLLKIADTTKPVITGKNAMVYKNSTTSIHDILELKVVDDVDGDITLDNTKVVIETSYDATAVGSYNVKVIATDTSNNVEEKNFTITVVDVAKISYPTTPIVVGKVFDPMDGIQVWDVDNTDITDKVVVTKNTVDTSKAGEYTVEYEVVDALGTTVHFARTVIVQKETTGGGTIEGEGTIDQEVIVDGQPDIQIITPPTGDTTNSSAYVLLMGGLLILGIVLFINRKKVS